MFARNDRNQPLVASNAQVRSTPFVWATWVSRLLEGDTQCKWAYWFRTHHNYTKSREAEFVRNWKLEHRALVDQTARELIAEDYEVFLEGENRFNLTGASGTMLAGCPDIVAVRGTELLIVDCKTGKGHVFHEYQVLTYMLCFPLARRQFAGYTVGGRIQYPDQPVWIYPHRIDDTFRAGFKDTMRILGDNQPPAKRPSYNECRFCDISAAYCAERQELPDILEKVETDLF